MFIATLIILNLFYENRNKGLCKRTTKGKLLNSTTLEHYNLEYYTMFPPA